MGVSVIPFAAWPFTMWADRKGLLEGGWQALRDGEQPSGAEEIIARRRR